MGMSELRAGSSHFQGLVSMTMGHESALSRVGSHFQDLVSMTTSPTERCLTGKGQGPITPQQAYQAFVASTHMFKDQSTLRR